MSSTNRGSRRSPADYYPTPAWCVHRLLEAVELPGGVWLEPCAGEGAILDAVQSVRQDIDWHTIELREDCRKILHEKVGDPNNIRIENLLDIDAAAHPRYPVLITNPPFRLAQEIVERSFALADTCILLLRLNFLASARRATLMRQYPPDVYVLPNRPSFSGGGKTDSVEYAWFVWHPRARRTHGTLQVLRPTPSPERRIL